jgi:hypothetical protein
MMNGIQIFFDEAFILADSLFRLLTPPKLILLLYLSRQPILIHELLGENSDPASHPQAVVTPRFTVV